MPFSRVVSSPKAFSYSRIKAPKLEAFHVSSRARTFKLYIQVSPVREFIEAKQEQQKKDQVHHYTRPSTN